jgi:hypothetical protein
MLPVDVRALEWLRKIRLALIARRVSVSRTVQYELSETGLRAARRAKPHVIEDTDATPERALTLALASASIRARRFLRKRGLQRADREDILADALAWCWENRENYSLTTTLDTWFVNAVRDSYKRYRRRIEHGNF